MSFHYRPKDAIKAALQELIHHGYPVQPEKWQGLKVKDDPRYRMVDCFNVDLEVSMSYPINENPLHYWANEIGCNLPWANDHFLERVGGLPLNPGIQYQNWPFYKRDAEMRSEGGKFSHTYMERYWPQYANTYNPPNVTHNPKSPGSEGRMGIRYYYGDLQSVVNLLAREPNTRQAYLPIWFPEDTGVLHGGRVPCTLGYWFRQRFDYLHVIYYIRSCDALRHLRDDIYLTIRLAHWILGQLIELDPEKWGKTNLGALSMKIGSLHCFTSDLPVLKGQIND